MNPINCRLFDFQIDNKKYEDDDGSSDDNGMKKTYKDEKVFEIQIFGIDEVGDTYCLFVNNFKPFFYIEVDDDWTRNEVNLFYNKLREEVTKYYSDSILQCKLIKKKSLYGFDNDKYYNFIFIEFENTIVFNKVKNLYFEEGNLRKGGYPMNFGRKETKTKIYESNIPPLLRYFHIQNISPSGWVTIEKYDNCDNIKRTTCKTEVIVSCNNIIPNNDKETIVPYKICSFDIEASSSHGDFPLPVKTYKKLAKNIVDHFNNYEVDDVSDRLKAIILYAFGFDNYATEEVDDIEKVYPKKAVSVTKVLSDFDKWLKNEKIRGKKNEKKEIDQILKFLTSNALDDDDEDNNFSAKSRTKITQNNIEDLLASDLPNEEKTNWIDESLSVIFPRLEGDKVTFIGSTFLTYGSKEPYLNHCLVLNSCDKLDNVNNSEIEICLTEKQVLNKWADLIQKEDPDIIIGYNIFGFDYEFMFQRAMELDCKDQFLRLSRNVDEVCYTKNRDGKISIEENKIILASGEHELKYIKMTGRLQVDMYNYFRRDFNLSSYKLDSVAGQYIGDTVINIEHINEHSTEQSNEQSTEQSTEQSNDQTIVKTNNMTGLYVGSFIQFEETSHSTEYYKDGTKFEIVNINKVDKTFTINGIETLNFKHKIRWGLSKDDVTPKDIFRLTNGDAKDRAIVAKYCIQDCNLVHHLMNKLDVLTGYVEMAKICSVPINFLVLRGQGIKLTSFIAKKCREKDTLMPVLYRKMNDDGYEGAIVLPPKCNLYLDNPVACVDYASLYPSSMISENLSHDSKVWTISYDLNGNVVNKEGILDEFNNFKYDNLPDYEYVDITYDTYQYIRSNPTKAAIKVRNGTKTCRWAQHKDKRRAIMPSILEELLAARKATKKLMKNESDDFMKNILDKRQVSYKLTANSLYGQCGARTSTFYEKDVAASTTATGRLLLTYAKRLIEEVYGKRLCNTTNHGLVMSNAEYVYGDTDSVFFTFNLQTPEGEDIRGKKALEITIELAKEAGALASKFLKKPHDLEYEKTFMPFCLLSKKRYVGMLYEEDVNVCSQKSMGIVLKRRDNAPIVKDIYGGIIDILMKEQDIDKAVAFLRTCLQTLMEEKYPIDKLIITKSLRSNYKNPKQIAHKVLADRIGKREPGNKPTSGDRIPFVYIVNNMRGALQGERIETPTYIRENTLKIDYSFYITNQIMKPVKQLFALVLENISDFNKKIFKVKAFNATLKKLQKELSIEQFEKKRDDIREKEIKTILFDEYLIKIQNVRNNNRTIECFF